MTAEEKIALLQELFSEAIENYKEAWEEVGDSEYMDGYMCAFVYGNPYYDGAFRKMFEVLAQ